MNVSTYLWLAAGVMVVLAGAAVWWQQRRRLARLHGELREAQDSRLELLDEAQALRRQLHAGVKPPPAVRASAGATLADAAQRRATLAAALDAAAPAAPGGWQDTMPMTGPAGHAPGYAPTQPAPLATRPAELMGDGKR
jgi:hypothetical protein